MITATDFMSQSMQAALQDGGPGVKIYGDGRMSLCDTQGIEQVIVPGRTVEETRRERRQAYEREFLMCRDCGVSVRYGAGWCGECRPYGFWHWVKYFSVWGRFWTWLRKTDNKSW